MALSYSAYGYFQYLFFYWIEYYLEQIQHRGSTSHDGIRR